MINFSSRQGSGEMDNVPIAATQSFSAGATRFAGRTGFFPSPCKVSIGSGTVVVESRLPSLVSSEYVAVKSFVPPSNRGGEIESQSGYCCNTL
jgi:hypothetical protein